MFVDDDPDSEPGCVTACRATVRDYLVHPRGGDLAELEAVSLIHKHSDLIKVGVEMQLYAYDVGDRILERERRTTAELFGER